ncbi:MAG: exo-alpha-sialidase [Candidatus Thermoplasmatota archaeon]|nr:exo-alpha-sialidase [Candidatus Thermoplasmatota archaeon]
MLSGRKRLFAVLFASLLISASFVIGLSEKSTAQDGLPWEGPEKLRGGFLLGGASDGNDLIVYGRNVSYSKNGGEDWKHCSVEGHFDVENGTIYGVKRNGSDYTGKTLQFFKSEDDAESWSDSVDIFTLQGRSDGAYGIEKIGSHLYVYSYDEYEGNWSIKVSRSEDGGETWSEPFVMVSDLSLDDPMVGREIVELNGRLYFSYYTRTGEDKKVMLISSGDEGETWGDEVKISDGGRRPRLKKEEGRIYLTYLKDESLYFSKSTDGEDWEDPKKIAECQDLIPFHSIAVRSDLVFVSYLNPIGGSNYSVCMNYSEDGGDTWQRIENVTGTDGDPKMPILLTSDENLHLFWTSSDWEYYHRPASIGDMIGGDDTSDGSDGSSDSGNSTDSDNSTESDDSGGSIPSYSAPMLLFVLMIAALMYHKKERSS